MPNKAPPPRPRSPAAAARHAALVRWRGKDAARDIVANDQKATRDAVIDILEAASCRKLTAKEVRGLVKVARQLLDHAG
jgi:hypothetical protein